MSLMLLTVALDGSTFELIDAVITAFEGTVVGLTNPNTTPPAVKELKNRTGGSLCFEHPNIPKIKIKLINPVDRCTMKYLIIIEINGKSRHLFRNPEKDEDLDD